MFILKTLKSIKNIIYRDETIEVDSCDGLTVETHSVPVYKQVPHQELKSCTTGMSHIGYEYGRPSTFKVPITEYKIHTAYKNEYSHTDQYQCETCIVTDINGKQHIIKRKQVYEMLSSDDDDKKYRYIEVLMHSGLYIKGGKWYVSYGIFLLLIKMMFGAFIFKFITLEMNEHDRVGKIFNASVLAATMVFSPPII